ncbi:hypothetical protein AAV30_03765 [Bacillus velezensis]|nr:hypothetical protein AAV30_03765 [Bacillus velezensis]
MTEATSYTIEEVAGLLKVSKLTVYDLIKKGLIPAYRVGRQMRVDEEDLKQYKANMRMSKSHPQQKRLTRPAGGSRKKGSPLSSAGRMCRWTSSANSWNKQYRRLRSASTAAV